MQSYVLDMLCQMLQLKVNYCLLDANNIFMEFILKLIESIETGIIRCEALKWNGTKLNPNFPFTFKHFHLIFQE